MTKIEDLKLRIERLVNLENEKITQLALYKKLADKKLEKIDYRAKTDILKICKVIRCNGDLNMFKNIKCIYTPDEDHIEISNLYKTLYKGSISYLLEWNQFQFHNMNIRKDLMIERSALVELSR
jgi:hypothetical protein